MPKPRIVLFSGELRNCPCYDTIFNSDFETASVASETDFLGEHSPGECGCRDSLPLFG